MTLPGRRVLALALGAISVSCASRSAPISYPANAPSSAQAPEAKPANVTLALSGEPPYAEAETKAPDTPTHEGPSQQAQPPMDHEHMHHQHVHDQHGDSHAH